MPQEEVANLRVGKMYSYPCHCHGSHDWELYIPLMWTGVGTRFRTNKARLSVNCLMQKGNRTVRSGLMEWELELVCMIPQVRSRGDIVLSKEKLSYCQDWTSNLDSMKLS